MEFVNVKPNDNVIQFASLEEKIAKLKEWKLLAPKANTLKLFVYKDIFTKKVMKCEIIGYIQYTHTAGKQTIIYETVVLEINGETNKINKDYLKDMQKNDFFTEIQIKEDKE